MNGGEADQHYWLPLVFLSLVVVDLVLMGTNVLGFHLLKRVISRLSDTEHLHDLVEAIVVVGIVLVIPEILEMVSDPIGTVFWGKSVAALTETMNEKVERLELIDFEILDAYERLELASAGKYGAVSMLLSFLFPVFQLVFFALAGLYLYTLSPPLALVIPLVFAPRIVSHLVRGSRYYCLPPLVPPHVHGPGRLVPEERRFGRVSSDCLSALKRPKPNGKGTTRRSRRGLVLIVASWS